MNNANSITVQDGVVTVATPEATITVQANCPAPEPLPFEAQTGWPVDASSSLRFSFVAGSCAPGTVGFGYDSCGYFGAVNEYPDGVTEPSTLFTIYCGTDPARTYVSLNMPEEIGLRAARVTLTHAATGQAQTLLGVLSGTSFQEQNDATFELVDGQTYYVEFAVANGGG